MAESIKKFIIKDAHGGTKESGSFSVVGEVHVNLVPGYGEPYADSEYVGGVLTITIHNIEGNGITDITTDSQEGDEAVNTVTIKTNANPEGVTLEVHNGSRGNGIASSSEVLSPDDGGTNTHTFTDDDGNVHTFHTKNGQTGRKGDQGDSAVYDPSSPDAPDFVMANTTGDSTTKAMTQKAVTDELVSIQKIIGEWGENLAPGLARKNCCLKNNGMWGYSSSKRQAHCVIEVAAGEVLLVLPTVTQIQTGWCAWLTSEYDDVTPADGIAVPYVEGTENMTLSKGEEHRLTVPSGAKYFCMNLKNGDATPAITTWVVNKRTSANKIDDLSEEVKKIKSIDTFVIDPDDGTEGKLYPKHYINSSNVWDSTGTSNNNSSMIFPISSGDIIKVIPQDGMSCDVEFLSDVPSGTNPHLIDGVRLGFVVGERTLVAPKGTKYLYMRKYNTAVYQAPSYVGVERCIGDVMRDSVNMAADYEREIANARHISANETGIGILHYTDIHGDSDAANQIIGWCNKYKKHIDDVLCTGDMVKYVANGNSDYPQGYKWWQNCGLPEISITTIGNHDGAIRDGNDHLPFDKVYNYWTWNGKGKEWDYDVYISQYHEGWGVVMPDGFDNDSSPNYKACFFHKDYADKGIRLICLDCMHRFDGIVDPATGQAAEGSSGLKEECLTTEQEEWLVAKLNETITVGSDAYGYSVIIASHFPLDDYSGANALEWSDRNHDYTDFNRNENGGYIVDYKTGYGSNWHTEARPSFTLETQFSYRNHLDKSSDLHYSDNGNNYKLGNVNNFGEIVKYWMEQGGKFVVWLSGHVHSNLLFYPYKYPNILVCSNTFAGKATTGSGIEAWKDGRAAANFITIDTTNHMLKIVRLGQGVDHYLKHTRYLCYDYINKKVISEG